MSNLSNVIHLTNKRLSFPHIAEPQKKPKEGGGERIAYSAELIMTPDDPDWQKTMQVVFNMATAKWKEQAQTILGIVQQDRKKRGYGWGQEKIKQSTLKVYEGYEGMVFITAGQERMPQIIDAQGNPIPPENTAACQALARKMYAGCRVNAAIEPWLQENQHGRAVRFNLVAIQFLADDTPFGEGVKDASGMFGATPGSAAPAAGAPPWGQPPAFGAPPAGQQAPAAPAWGQPQVGMPAAPFPAQQPAPNGPPFGAPAPNYGTPPGFGAPPNFGAPAAPPWG